MRKNRFAAIFLAILLTSLALPVLTHPVTAQPIPAIIEEKYGWKTIETPVITIRYPADGRWPVFLWWYTGKPEMIYVVKFQGLIEYFTFVDQFYKERYQALAENLYERFFKPTETELEKSSRIKELLHLGGIIKDIYKNWHPPYLPFKACNWTLTEAGNFTNKDGDVIGFAWAFKLVETYMPRFEFAENNITIRCRFYYEPATEVVKKNGEVLYEYKVDAHEMKMDFMIENWKWNIDILKPLISVLRDEYEIEIPERKSRLALWINLASINVTKIREAMINPENIEYWSICSHMIFDGRRIFIGPDRTGEDARPWDVRKKLHDHFKLRFATPNETLAGFFKFIASAKVTPKSEAGELMEAEENEVVAAYIGTENHMRLFIGYPYFNGTLEHDPSIGVEVPGTTTPEATTPKYVVEVPSGSQIAPRVIERIGPQFITPELVIALVVVMSTIAIAAFVAKRKGKIVNVIGVK